jgi:DNA-binding PadR family transcriptional regulator
MNRITPALEDHKMTLLEEIQQALSELEQLGLIRRNGEMRPDRRKLRPVYVLTGKGKLQYPNKFGQTLPCGASPLSMT